MTKFYVYGLIDPITEELRYVGSTYRLNKRYNEHISQLKKNSYKNNWIKQLLSQNIKPEMFIIEECETEEEMYKAEEWHIIYFKQMECRLTNNSIGGRGGSKGVIRS